MRPDETLLVLFDNGSLHPAATLRLRQIADTLAASFKQPVCAASVLHSGKIPPAQLGGVPAALVEEIAHAFWRRNPAGEVLLVPAFFGPSRTIGHYLAARLGAAGRWRMAPCLVDCGNPGDLCNALVAEALACEARRVLEARNLTSAARVLLVDHGSPEPAVTAVREFLAARLRALLGGEVAAVGAASMERRAGERYAFNDPLAAAALRAPPFDEGDVVVLLQFLAPGRHAGEEGDIAAICAAARAERPALRTWLAEPIGASPQVREALGRRLSALIDK